MFISEWVILKRHVTLDTGCNSIQVYFGNAFGRQEEVVFHLPASVHNTCSYVQPCMVAVTILLSKYTILYGKVLTLVVTITVCC